MSLPNNITYEFYFPNGDFDQTIFDNYGSNDFQLQTNCRYIVATISRRVRIQSDRKAAEGFSLHCGDN